MEVDRTEQKIAIKLNNLLCQSDLRAPNTLFQAKSKQGNIKYFVFKTIFIKVYGS